MGVLRLLLALSVLIGHSDHSGGLVAFDTTVAVRAFYMISGFYMALVLSTKYQGKPYYVFIRSRYLRLFPAYFATIMLTCLYGWAVYHIRGTVEWPFQAWLRTLKDLEFGTLATLALSNVFILGQDLLSFCGVTASGALSGLLPKGAPANPAGAYMLIPQAWTLGIELCFYLVAPFLARRSAMFLGGLALVSLGCRLYFDFPSPLDGAANAFGYRFFPFELTFFCLGMLAYKGYALLKRHSVPQWLGVSMVLAGGATFAWAQARPQAWPAYMLLAVTVPFLFLVSKEWKLDRMVGELSYPVYIIHMLALKALEQFTSWGTELPSIAVTLLLSALLLLLVDRPLDRWRETLTRSDLRRLPRGRWLSAAAVAFSLVVAVPWYLGAGLQAKHLERSIPLEAVDLMRGQPERMVVEGLDPAEHSAGATWRWGLGPKTELLFSLPSNANIVLTLEYTQLPAEQNVIVSFNGQVLETLQCEGTCSVYRQYTLPGGREDNVIRFEYGEWNGLAAQILPEDSRPLAVSFTKLSLDFYDPRKGALPARKN
ncbi:acyltransferase family protein [Fundidesulfovibrio agrisoli]|uniref:acyltransferase family protein n=1 Tax=Fundidesulfovibrio agrisoli TaxID=2922717 RepID=UPI001FAD4F08|nr:acyltransferase [Fundidesulfovibrio agrisoli]